MTNYLFLTIILLVLGLSLFTWFQVRRIEQRYPATGDFTDVGGYRLHAVHLPKPKDADLPSLVFIHGASGNLHDQMQAFRSRLEGRAEMLFVDRPGHGWSGRHAKDGHLPESQAGAIAALMEQKEISQAIIVGHSFGGVIALTMAMEKPEKVAGLLLLSTPSHPWPGGVDWHYTFAARPFFGKIFTWLATMPAGLLQIRVSAQSVFTPNAFPQDYLQKTATALVLRPRTFRNNAADIAWLRSHVVKTSPHYKTIKKPTIIITGEDDDVVSPTIHSGVLASDIEGARLIRLPGIGHKPDYAATDLCIAAIEEISGKAADLLLTAEPSAPFQDGALRADQIPVRPSDPI
ncbi:MAG: alpha/beta hydrolase [Rhizobiaceae bacterium]|nr:alpha/beta hydrolase [Rhizobiaceae bacterium]